jgi:hypothetical protein
MHGWAGRIFDAGATQPQSRPNPKPPNRGWVCGTDTLYFLVRNQAEAVSM